MCGLIAQIRVVGISVVRESRGHEQLSCRGAKRGQESGWGSGGNCGEAWD